MKKHEGKSNGKVAMRPISAVIQQNVYNDLLTIKAREERTISQLVHIALKEFVARRLKRKAA